MTSNTLESGNSLPFTTGSASRATSGPATATAATVLAWREFPGDHQAPLPDGFEDIDTVVAAMETDPARRASMTRARQRLAQRVGGRVGGLAALRLKRGLSQKQLADAIGTSQPHIARIESGRPNVMLATANQLAVALGVTLNDINEALGFDRRSA